MKRDVPVFAVVGAVNHGKSSVVAALAEDDDVRISAMPGETVANRQFSVRDLLVFFDTPGFQNARKALAAIDAIDAIEAADAAHRSADPLQPFRVFIERQRDNPDFDAECRLLQPIADGAGVIYVVDGSRPLRDINLSEMEVLRRTGAPRLAIINRTGSGDHIDEWKGRLDQHFNIVRTFDAHRATWSDRKDLIEALASIERGWKDRLREAAHAMQADRDARIDDAAALIADLLVDVLQHAETVPADRTKGELDRKQVAERLQATFMAAIAAKERDAHRKLIALYAHRHVVPDAMPADLFRSDLFAEETWQLLGLGLGQLVGVSTVGGGIAGAAIDAATLGHSFGLGAAIGAAAGGGGAYLLGKRRPEIAIAWPTAGLPGVARSILPRNALRFGGADVVVGPLKAENFPWILLDRALCLFATVYTRSHARRDDAVANVEALLPILDRASLTVSHWSDAERAACQRVFRSLRAGRQPGDEPMDRLRSAIRDALERVADAERLLGDA